MSLSCEYCAIPGYYGEIIYETPNWIIFLAPSQRYLGTCVIALKRQCKDLLELSSEEWAEFGKIVNNMENTINQALKPTLFNWSCFKNATFRSENPQPEIHWHFIPRYKYPVEFEGITFEDPDFGYIPQPIERKIPSEVMEKLMELIKKNLEV
jgi:diadenosine tetraphosphate (Ap4A) HIT family hydrolase